MASECQLNASPLKVLLVDDGDHDRLAISHALRNSGVLVAEFSCGGDALRAFQKSPSFDVAVVDYKMPDMDGLSLVSELKRDRKSLVAVLVTGYDAEGLADTARNCGCDGYLPKNISGDYLSELSSKIEECLALVKERQLLVDELGEDFLVKAEGLAGAVLDAVGMSVWEFDRESGSIRLGRLWRRLLGYADGEIDTLRRLLSVVHPQDRRKLLNSWREHVRQASSNFVVECRMLTHAGGWRWIASTGRAVKRDSTGRPLRMLGASRDVDERKRSEDALLLEKSRYEWLVNSVDGIVWEADPLAMRFTFVSRKAQEMLGYPVEQWLSEPDFLASHIHPDDRERVLRLFRSELDAGRPLKLEYRVVAADGREVWLNCIVNVSLENGRPNRVCGVMFDISARVALESELKSFSEEISKVNTELLEYARAVSHDLKSPLRAIYGYASFLQEDLSGSLTEEQAKYFSSISQAALDAGNLVDGLLRISRVSAHKMDWQPVDIALLIRDTLSTMEMPKDVSLRLPQTMPVIVGEPLLLKQIFQNLIDNAIKFNKSGSKRVWLSCSETPNAWRLSVSDNGIGIKPEHFERVFGVFERLNPTDFDGSGVGLAIVKRAVQRLSGTIGISVSSEGGAKFEITLPKRRLDRKGGVARP